MRGLGRRPEPTRPALNYRHAFHAGNFADVMKHVLLTRILAHLVRKPGPFRFVDSHAGTGLYDLGSDEAERTGEGRGGVGRIEAAFPEPVEALLAEYRRVLAETRDAHGPSAYPGSPAVARAFLRSGDRAIMVEKHPEDGSLLRSRFGRDRTCKVLEADGWAVLPGLVPPPERRGLVLVDPPYEAPGELARGVAALEALLRKWPTGIAALWYPIKDPGEIAPAFGRLGERLRRPCLRLELLVDRPAEDPTRLNGSGLLVANPPWPLAGEADLLLPALSERLARAAYGAYRAEWLNPALAG